MSTDFVKYHQHLEDRLGQLGRELPGPMGGFARLHRKAVDDGALPGRVKELMALAISAVIYGRRMQTSAQQQPLCCS